MGTVAQTKEVVIDYEEERKEILRRYRLLLRHAKPFLKAGDTQRIRKAFLMAMAAHKGMRRKSGEPFIYHPLAVALICVDEIGLGTTSIIASLMHDVVEDTEIELAEIKKHFGSKITTIIEGLTKIAGALTQGSSAQAENFRKILLTLSKDARVILIKIADRLHNMRTLSSLSRSKQLKIASETIYLYAPLAHRLGLYSIKSELEDLYFKYTHLQAYHTIAHRTNQIRLSRSRFIRQLIKPIQEKLKEHHINAAIKKRFKSIYSTWTKMQKQKIPFEQVYDIFAIRIVIDAAAKLEKAACWRVYAIISDIYQPNPDRLRDWISRPKANGYESLHSTVMSPQGQWVEIQIRTQRMDEIAEKGYAAHWKYKEKKSHTQESGIEQWLVRLRELLENKHHTTAIDFVDAFRADLSAEEVYAFTPKGDMKVLPRGASVLDFAFDIHTEVGKACIGAKNNQKLEAIDRMLENGDQIEILTSSKQKPRVDWLNFVKTSKAKTAIKQFLKEERLSLATLGKEILQRKLKHMKVPADMKAFDKIAEHFHLNGIQNLYYQVGKGKIDGEDIKKLRTWLLESSKKLRANTHTQSPHSPTKAAEADTILINNASNSLDYTLSPCCHPIPGDEIFGFTSVHDGIKIHRTTCPNAPEMLSHHGERIIQAQWSSQYKGDHLTTLYITGIDRIGIVQDVMQLISSQFKVNAKSVSMGNENGIFKGEIKLYTQSIEHLRALINKIKTIQGVVNIERLEG